MDWAAATFHWGKLRDLTGRDSAVELRYKHAIQCETSAFSPNRAHQSIPPRDPRSTPQQIDLTSYYNESLGAYVLTGRRDIGLSVVLVARTRPGFPMRSGPM